MLTLVAFIVLPQLLRIAVRLVYMIVDAWLDRRLPDDLPLAAGAWAEQQLREQGLDVAVAIGPGDAYSPGANLLILSENTYCKHDPSYWAAAAHEIGHAWWHRRTRAFSVVALGARQLGGLAGSWITVLLAANLLYGARAVDGVVQVLLFLALAVAPLVLADEAMASATALWLLRHEPAMRGRRLAAAVANLAAAFGTYLAAAVGELVLLVVFGRVRVAIEARVFMPAPPMAAWRWAAVLLLTALVVLRIVKQLRAVIRPAERRAGLSWRWDLPALLLLVLVWNQPLGTPFVYCVMLGALALDLLKLPLAMPSLLFTVLATLLVRRWLKGEPLDRRARLLPVADAKSRLLAANAASAGWMSRLGPLADLMLVPLVVRLWLAAAGY